MQQRMLGQTGLQVSIIGFGGIPIRKLTREEAIPLIKCVLDSGINFLDTAQGYGDSEIKIGRGIAGRREEAILATKSPCRTSEGALKDIEVALRRLSTEIIDLYQVHQVSDEKTLNQVLGSEGALKGLEKAQKQGKIKHIGITGHNADILLSAIRRAKFSTVQFPFNIVEDGESQRTLLREAKERNIGVIIMKPLAGGIIEEPALSLRWILQEDVTVVIPGMILSWEVEANARVGEKNLPLTSEELARLKKAVEPLEEEFCRRCMYCMPCPEGVPIYLIQELGDKVKVPQARELCREIYAKLKVNALDCSECGECEEKCPYHLPIRKMIKEKHLLLTQ